MAEIKIHNKKDHANNFVINPRDIDVGQMIQGNKDTSLKIGDKVYMVFSFDSSGEEINKGNFISRRDAAIKAGTDSEFLIDYFDPFFTFKTEVGDQVLAVTPVSAKFDNAKTDKAKYSIRYLLDTTSLDSGEKIVTVWATHKDSENQFIDKRIFSQENPFYLNQSFLENLQKNITNGGIADKTGLDRSTINYPAYLPVGLQPVNPFITKDVALWEVIRNGTNALSFKNYSAFMDYVFCGGINPFDSRVGDDYKAEVTRTNKNLSLPFNNVDAYRALKVATEAFVMATIQVSGKLDARLAGEYDKYLEAVPVSTRVKNPESLKILPYLALIRHKLPDLDIKEKLFEESLDGYLDNQPLAESCYGLINSKMHYPCFIELIWNYWTEESMMVQGITSIARRFQNIRSSSEIDGLANVEIGPLRTLNNLLWGYIQDEQHRLTVRRRAYEYDHHYGITLQGSALRGMRMADSRSKFIEAFHTLLNLAVKFYHQYDDTTVVADAFPVMNALKEVHMILSEGAHNQYGDLPSTARIEMLMQEYILARPEFREFLPTRQMVAYPEPWMDRVGVLNQMHNWTNTNVMHFRDLAIFGEQIVLSIRFGAWSDVINRDQAGNWAIFWRPQISNYIHAYRAATGMDLSREDGQVDAQQPSIHLLKRLKEQNLKAKI